MRKILFIFFNLILINTFAQKDNTTIPIELLIGHRRTNFQLNVNRSIYKNIRFMSMTSASADYKNTKEESDLIMNNTVTYQFYKNFNFGLGVQYHYFKGFIPELSASAIYANQTWTLLLNPYFQLLPTINLETVAMIEFKPLLTQSMRLYTQIQGLYNHNFTNKNHERSFYNFRLGLKINKITFGAGARLDYYGAKKLNKENYGVFFKYDF
jgi:hypothetical protein